VTLFLAIETATDLGSVAVGDPAGAAAEIAVGGRRHAAALAPAVHEVLRLAGARYGDLEGIVVADGPGSFTGLRIGFATALGILRSHDRLALHTAPSMLAAAWHVAPFASGPIAVLYDALRGEVFGAVYGLERSEQRAERTGEGEGGRGKGPVALDVIVEPCLTTVSDLVRRCPVTPLLGVGDGAAAYEDEVRAWTGRAPVGPPAGSPRAAALLGLLGVPGATRRVDDPTTFEPTYGRLAEAQVRWEREHGRPLPHPYG
jgi:tRNA threonylcarbamoyladenosine biosynthesis protein TsaB